MLLPVEVLRRICCGKLRLRFHSNTFVGNAKVCPALPPVPPVYEDSPHCVLFTVMLPLHGEKRWQLRLRKEIYPDVGDIFVTAEVQRPSSYSGFGCFEMVDDDVRLWWDGGVSTYSVEPHGLVLVRSVPKSWIP